MHSPSCFPKIHGFRCVSGWDGRGSEVCIYSLEWEVLGQVVHLLILKLFNVDPHISYKYNFSMFNFLWAGFFSIQSIQKLAYYPTNSILPLPPPSIQISHNFENFKGDLRFCWYLEGHRLSNGLIFFFFTKFNFLGYFLLLI